MARQQIWIYIDDVTGEQVDHIETVTIMHGAAAYEVDMAPDTLAEYEKVIEPYRSAGRRVTRRPEQPARVPARVDKAQRQAVRAWWRRYGESLGLPPVTDRGRIPEQVTEAYQTHRGQKPEDVSIPVQPSKPRRKAEAVGARMSFKDAEVS